MDGITASSGLQTAVLCQSSGGEVIADSVACLASSARFKENIQPLGSGLDESNATTARQLSLQGRRHLCEERQLST